MYKGITILNKKDKTFAKVSKDEKRVYAGNENPPILLLQWLQ